MCCLVIPVNDTQTSPTILFGDPVDDSSLNLAPPAVTHTTQPSSVSGFFGSLSPSLVDFRNMDIAND